MGGSGAGHHDIGRKDKKLLLEKIICRFDLTTEIISENGTQFETFYIVEHPQSNGQEEVANKVILRGLRKRLEEAKGRWVEELPQVLWSYHTTPHSTTNETPFHLTFRIDIVIPVEIGESSPRVVLFQPSENNEELRVNLDLLQEEWEVVHVREYAVKARVARRHDRRLVAREFKCQDLVLRKITRLTDSNKLTLVWKGPFKALEDQRRIRGWLYKAGPGCKDPQEAGYIKLVQGAKTHRRPAI
ncbi:Tf2-6, partial [Mucuna pruriens]